MMKENINEEWRAVKGYEGRYAVSNLGRVKSLGNDRARKEKILKPAKNKDGYCTVGLRKNGVSKTQYVHVLVAKAFIPNPDPEKYDVVNHKIEGVENRSINTVDNLEWCDTSHNLKYGTAQERRVMTWRSNGYKGLSNTHLALCKTVYQYTLSGELVKEWQSATEVERQTGWYQSAISACCRNRYNPNGTGAHNVYEGYIWSYTPLTACENVV